MSKNVNRGEKNPSATKAGPGRYHSGGEPGTRVTKARPTRAYRALMAAWASKRVVKWKGLRDEHGAYTETGTWKRKWLAGISAQRGY